MINDWIKFRGTLFFVKTIDTKSPKIWVRCPKSSALKPTVLRYPP